MAIWVMDLRTNVLNTSLPVLIHLTNGLFTVIRSTMCRRVFFGISKTLARRMFFQMATRFYPPLAGDIIQIGCTATFSGFPMSMNLETIFLISWERNTGDSNPPDLLPM